MPTARFTVDLTDRIPPLMRLFLRSQPKSPFALTAVWVSLLLAVVFSAAGIDYLTRTHSSAHYLSITTDYSSLYHAWMIGYLWARGGEYLHRLSISLSSLVSNGAAQEPRRRVSAQIARANKLLQSRVTHIGVAALSVATCAAGTYAYSARGAFGLADNGNLLHTIRYTNTWASFPRVGFFAFLFVSSLGAYIIYWIAIVTVVVVRVWMRCRRNLGLRLALECADGRWGWGNVASLIDVGGRMLTVNIVGLTAIAWRGGFSQPQYFAFFPVACLAGLLPYIYANRIWRDALEEPPLMPSDTQADRTLRAMIYATVPKNLAPTRAAVYQIAFIVLPGVVALVDYLSKSK